MDYKQREKQINKETKISIGMYIAYFLWWFITGYGFSKGDPQNYKMVMGLPMWFFLSSVIGYIWFSIATIFTVNHIFKNMNLDTEKEKKDGE